MNDETPAPAPAPAPAPVRRLRGRLARALVTVLSGLFLGTILIVGGLYLRLEAGPIKLDMLIPAIEAEATAQLPGVTLTLGGARLELSDEAQGGAVLTALDMVLSDEKTGPFARAPEVSAEISIWDFLTGNYIPNGVTLSGVSGRLVRDETGAFSFGLAGLSGGDAGDGAAAFSRLLSLVLGDEPEGAQGPAAESALFAGVGERSLRLKDISVAYDDRFGGRAYRAEHAEIAFTTGDDGIEGRAHVTLDGGGHGRVSGDLSGRLGADGVVALEVAFGNAAPSDIAGQISALDWLTAFDAPVGGRMDLTIDRRGDLLSLSGRLEAGEGALSLGDGAVEPLRSAALEFSFDPATERFLIGEVALDADRARLHATGFAQVNRDEEGAPKDVVAQLDFRDIAVTAPEFLDAPIDYRSGRLTGRVILDPLEFEIGELRLEREEMKLSVAGKLWPEPEGLRADLAARGSDISLAELMAHWPRQAAPGARAWMRDNMEAAHIRDVNAVVRLGGDEETMKIDFSFDRAVGYYLRPMPPIRDGVGSGQVDLKRFSLSLESGDVTPEGGQKIDLAGSTFVIADLEDPVTPGRADIRAVGRIADALALIDSDPLNLTSRLDAPLGDVGGQATVDTVATMPLLKDLLLEDVKVESRARLTDVSLTAPGIDKLVTAKTLALRADTAGFDLSGDVTVASIPANVDWKERFSPSGRSITVKADATPERLAAFGVEQTWFASGRMPVTAALSPGASRTSFSLTAALGPAGLSVPEIGWTKPEGAEGALKLEGAFAGAQVTLDKFEIRARDLTAVGAAKTDADGAPQSLALSELRYRGAIDAAVTAMREKRMWKVAAEGSLLDFTRLGDLVDDAISDGAGAERESGAAVAPFRIDLKIDHLQVMEDRSFEGFTGFLRRTGKNEVIAEGAARLAGGAPVQVNFRRGPEGGRVRIKIDDAGRFLRDAKAFDDGSGGVLVVNGDIAPGDPLRIDGRLRVRDIVIHKDAKLEQMLDGAALSELQKQMRDQGIVFDSIRGDFTYGDDVIELDDVVAKGPSIGIDISGDYVIEADRLNMNGVFTPLYKVNSAIGKIPLIGTVLTGGDGQGIFAFTFSVTGTSEDPKVSVNPLSVLTPGILRRIFEGGSGDGEDMDNMHGLPETSER